MYGDWASYVLCVTVMLADKTALQQLFPALNLELKDSVCVGQMVQVALGQTEPLLLDI